MKYLEGKTLAEKQMHYYNGHRCPYCDKETELINSAEIYGKDYGLMYICRPCKAHVGTHAGSDQAFGPLAKKELRDLRHETHKYFDVLWQKKVSQGFSLTQSRRSAYTWLGQMLGVDKVESHIGYCNEEQCRKIIEECKKFIKGSPENKQHKETYVPSRTAEVNVMLIEGMEPDYNYSLSKVSITYYRLIHKESKHVFMFNVETEVGRWLQVPNPKWKRIPDIEKFIKRYFKNPK